MNMHRPPADLVPVEPAQPVTPVVVQPTGYYGLPPQKPRWSPAQIAVVGAAALVTAQMILPTQYTPGAIIGRVFVIVEKQRDMAEAEILAIREQLTEARKRYGSFLAEYEALYAKCGFGDMLLGPEAGQICRNALNMNYQPQLASLRSEIDRLEKQLRDMESTL